MDGTPPALRPICPHTWLRPAALWAFFPKRVSSDACALTPLCHRLVQWHDVTYGKHSWELPRLAQALQAPPEAEAAVFLSALLQGQVLVNVLRVSALGSPGLQRAVRTLGQCCCSVSQARSSRDVRWDLQLEIERERSGRERAHQQGLVSHAALEPLSVILIPSWQQQEQTQGRNLKVVHLKSGTPAPGCTLAAGCGSG